MGRPLCEPRRAADLLVVERIFALGAMEAAGWHRLVEFVLAGKSLVGLGELCEPSRISAAIGFFFGDGVALVPALHND